jgi:FkbM family methyltransferase
MMKRVNREKRTRPTLTRRALRLVQFLGVTVHDVAPGTVVISRRNDMQVQQMRGAAVLARRNAVQLHQVTHATFIARPNAVDVQQVPGGAIVTRPGKTRVVTLGNAAALVLPLIRPALADRPTEKDLYTHLLSHHVAHVFDLYGVNCVLDVGGNLGQYGKQLRRAGYRGRIVSFEPVPDVAAKLRRAAEADSDWLVHEVALGREDGTTQLNVVSGSLSSSLPASDFGARRYARLRRPVVREVPMRRLDGLMDMVLAGVDNPRPFLKVDTQGFDLEVFAGLGTRVADVVAMQSEVALVKIYEGMPRLPEALGVFEEAGFEVSGFFPVSREATTGRVLEFDCVLVRQAAQPVSN